MHMPPDNKDIWMPNSVSMAVWRRMWKAHAKSPVWVFTVYTKTHASVSVWACVSEGVQEWVDGLGWVAATHRQHVWVWQEIWKQRYQKVHSAEGLNRSLLISLHLSHMSTCRERGRQLFVCIFCLTSSPAAHIYSSWQSSLSSNSRAMFLQLFRHRHFVAMSQSSTRHSAVLIHIQAPHSML